MQQACRNASGTQAFSKLGPYYEKAPGGGRTLFAAGEEAKRGKGVLLRWLRVYVAAGGPVRWELNGIMWNTEQEAA